ncbi:MAG TPA: class IV adenylate cyclase [Bryobacteraceae bacterium]|nr:class IV adenylate cyclase [Bryobacteraceae bacterium]
MLKIEIEIKLRVPGDIREIRRKLRRLGFRIHKRRVFESNVLFDDAKQRLRKHGKLLRVRRSGRRGLLTLKGPPEQGVYKKRWEIETELPDSDSIERIFAQLGYHPVFRYEKFRTEYTRGSSDGKAQLDETPIGNFLELEGRPRWIERTAKLLGFSRADYVNRTYGSLYLAYCKERRIQPRDMLFKARSSGR